MKARRGIKNKSIRLILAVMTLLLIWAAPVYAAKANGWNAAHTIYYKNGKKYSGAIKLDKKYYLFKKGKLQKGFQIITYKGKQIIAYYDTVTGEKVFGNKEIDGYWYYFQKGSGRMLTGWKKVNGKKKYYYDPDGRRLTGHQIIGKALYVFDSDGVLRKKISVAKSEKYLGTSKRGTKTYSLVGLTEEQIIEKMGPLFTEDQKKTGVLASVSMAQFILESWYGRSELALMGNNCFGMKQNLSGNTWPGTLWDGNSVYIKKTQEEDDNGKIYTITAAFRRYECIEDSIGDHSAYLLGARDETGKLRYFGLKGCKSYKKAAKIIKNGGYATDSSYVDSLCSLIRRWNLTRFDVK